MNMTTGKDDQEFNEPFDQLLREMKPPVPDSKKEREAFRNVFRKNMAAKRVARKKRRLQNLKLGSVVMMLVVVSVFAFNLSELGSDGFDLVEVEDALTPGGVVKNEFRGDGFNVLEGISEQGLKEINQYISGINGKIILCEAWEINGKMDWWVTHEINIDGENTTVKAPLNPSSFTMTKAHASFYTERWAGWEEKILSQSNLPMAENEMPINGSKFNSQIWSLVDPNYGDVKYLRCVPIH